MPIHIRDAKPDDLDAVLAHMRALAERKRFHVLVAVSDTAVVGYATYMVHFSPWAGREYLFLDDQFYRGLGAELREKRIAYWSREAMRAQVESRRNRA